MGLGWAYSFMSTLAHHLNFMVGPTNKAVWGPSPCQIWSC